MSPIPLIVSAVRTPIGKLSGALSPLSATDLGALVVHEAIRRAGIPPEGVDEVVMGNVVSAGLGQAPARQAAMRGGMPPEVPAYTVNKVCGSGLKAVMLAAQAIRAGDAQVVVAGGMEGMSNAPFLIPGARRGLPLGHARLVDALVHDGLWCAFEDQSMGDAAEFIAEKFGITRREQDEYALESHRRAVRAMQEGKFKAEIVPVEVPQPKGSVLRVDVDESPRPDASLERLSTLKPVFRPDGTVTPGNAPGLNDGAAALVVTSQEAAERYGLHPLARITGYVAVGVAPAMIFQAPVLAVRRLCDRPGCTVQDFDLLEINEAFSAQILANGRELGWDWGRVNVHGGAVALGHPLGASGARILTTLLYAMRDRGARTGLAALCLGGGNAVAMSIEAV